MISKNAAIKVMNASVDHFNFWPNTSFDPLSLTKNTSLVL